MGILEQLEAGLRPGLEIPELARSGMPQLELEEPAFNGLLLALGVFNLLTGGSTGDTDLLLLLVLLLLLLSSCLPVHCIPLVARPSLEVARGIANWPLTRLARLLVASRPICWCLVLLPILLLLFNWPVGWSRWRLLTEAIWLLVEEESPLVVELERPLLVEETSPLEATGLGRPIPTVCGCCR